MDNWPGMKRPQQEEDRESSHNPKSARRTWESIGLCPEILDQIFKHVDFERLKTYRLVCKTWNQESCRAMGATANVTEKSRNLNGPQPRFNRRLALIEFMRRRERVYFSGIPFGPVPSVVGRKKSNPTVDMPGKTLCVPSPGVRGTLSMVKIINNERNSFGSNPLPVPPIPIKKAVEDVDRELQLLQLLKEGESLNLPIPFKSLYMTPKYYYKPKQISVVQELSNRVPITKLAFPSMIGNLYLFPKISNYVIGLLILCSKTLTELEIQFLDTSLESQIVFRFPRLKKLTLKYPGVFNVGYTNHIEMEARFFGSICSSSPGLKELVLDGISSSPQLLQRTDLGKIEELTVRTGQCSAVLQCTSIWTELKNARIGHLKALKLGRGMSRNSAQEFPALLSRFSDSIERLSLLGFKVEQLPFCPKLTHLDCGSLLADAWDPSLFPALQSLKLEKFRQAPTHMNLVQIPTVREIWVEDLVPAERELRPSKQDELEVMELLAGLLPNATSWTLPYMFLEGLIQVASARELNVESLAVTEMMGQDPLRSDGDLRIAEAERAEYQGTIATLSKLSGLKELTFCNPNGGSESNKLQVEAVDFKSIPKLRTFRHIGLGLENCLSLKEHLSSLDTVKILNWGRRADSEEAKGDQELLTQIPNLELVFTGKHNLVFDSFVSRYM